MHARRPPRRAGAPDCTRGRRLARGAWASGLFAALLACTGAEVPAGRADAAPAGATATAAATDALTAPAPASVVQPGASMAGPAAGELATPAGASAADGYPQASGLAAVRAQLDATLQRASACTTDSECHSIAVGAKACGGPQGYRAYSERSVTTDAVAALAQRERELARVAARASGRVSNCLMLADPGARCVQGRCATGNATGGAATR